MRRLMLIGLVTLAPAAAFAQSANQVESCFQNPQSCSWNNGVPTPMPQGQPHPAAPAPAPAPAASAAPRAPDYTTVLNSPEPDRRKLQESLRTLDKYNGPIDGDLQSEATTKGIAAWQKGHGYTQSGKLTPTEAVTLNNEASRVPIKRLDPKMEAAAAAAAAPPSNADRLRQLQARLAERRKAAEPKANAATEALVKDLKAYVAADGKGAAGEQFPDFAKWYAGSKSAGRTVGDIKPAVEDYGDAKTGAAATAEVMFETKQGDSTNKECMMFAWIEGNPRKDPHAFACDDVAGVEKWKTDQVLKSAWR